MQRFSKYGKKTSCHLENFKQNAYIFHQCIHVLSIKTIYSRFHNEKISKNIRRFTKIAQAGRPRDPDKPVISAAFNFPIHHRCICLVDHVRFLWGVLFCVRKRFPWC